MFSIDLQKPRSTETDPNSCSKTSEAVSQHSTTNLRVGFPRNKFGKVKSLSIEHQAVRVCDFACAHYISREIWVQKFRSISNALKWPRERAWNSKWPMHSPKTQALQEKKSSLNDFEKRGNNGHRKYVPLLSPHATGMCVLAQLCHSKPSELKGWKKLLQELN